MLYKSFISSRLNELKPHRTRAGFSCMQNLIDPFVFEWEHAAAMEMRNYLESIIRESHLFIGIYGESYGPKILESPDEPGKMVSPIEFELQLALRHVGRDNIFLFCVADADRELELQSMLGNLVYKEFTSENEFALLVDEVVKAWQRDRKAKENTHSRSMMSVSVECVDRPGLLASASRAVFVQGGNIVRARQVVDLGNTSIRVFCEWPNANQLPDEKLLETVVRTEVQTLLSGPAGSSVMVEAKQLQSTDGNVTAKGVFEVQYHDGPGIADRIFSIFSEERISILETHLEQLSLAPPIGRFEITTNASELTQHKVSLLAKELGKLAGVFFVREHLQLGNWWY